MSNAILAALAAHASATARPDAADWRSVADMLRACVKVPKARAGAVQAGGWVSYPAGPKCTFESIVVTFADGMQLGATAAQNPGKPISIGPAVLGAIAFYRRRVYSKLGHVQPSQFSVTLAAWDAAIAVPDITDVRLAESGEAFDAAACNAATVDARAGTFVLADAERAAGRFSPIDQIGMVESAYVRAWRAAFLPAELASRAAHNARRAAHEARRVAERHDSMGEAVAAWCEAVGPSYAMPAPWEVTGTVDAPEGLDGTGPAPAPAPGPDAPAPAPADPAPRKRAPRKARGGGDGGGAPVANATDGAPVESPSPEAIDTAPEAIACPIEALDHEPVPSTSHPVVAHCHSPKARAALFGRIMDGTFPADGAQGKAGSFRITYADAVACEGLPSIRLTGMPRKAYTRRPASLPAVSVPFHIPAGAFTPASAMAGMPVTLHAPSI